MQDVQNIVDKARAKYNGLDFSLKNGTESEAIKEAFDSLDGLIAGLKTEDSQSSSKTAYNGFIKFENDPNNSQNSGYNQAVTFSKAFTQAVDIIQNGLNGY